MLNSQLQPSSQHQQLLATDNGNAPGYFIFDDLTTALQERSSNDQSTIAHQPLLQHQQKYLFGELSQKNQIKMKKKPKKKLHVYPLYAPTSFYITIDHDHVLFHRWIFCIKKSKIIINKKYFYQRNLHCLKKKTQKPPHTHL